MAKLEEVLDTRNNYADQLAGKQATSTELQDVGLLLLRLIQGGLLAGHGSQKLFGMFGGYGLKGTAGWLESMGLKPGNVWAVAAGAGEFSGSLVALGLLHPLGEVGTIAAMAMAIAKAHWGKPIWVTQGGAELPVINIAISLGLMFTGPGRYSLDRAFHIKVPTWVSALAAVGAVGSLAYGIKVSQPAIQPATSEQNTAIPAERS